MKLSKMFQVITVIALICIPLTPACGYILGDLYVEGKCADFRQWECGFSLSSHGASEYVQVWFYLEIGDDFYFITDNGFGVSQENTPFGTIFIEEGSLVTVKVFDFYWPPGSLPEFSHFWIWFNARSNSGDYIGPKTIGETYWGNYVPPTQQPTITPTPTYTPRPQPTMTPSPSFTPYPTPTQMPTYTPTRTPTIPPMTPTPSAIPFSDRTRG